MPEGKYYRRGHWVNRPKRKSTMTIPIWVIAAVIAVAWVMMRGGGDDNSGTSPAGTQTSPNQVVTSSATH